MVSKAMAGHSYGFTDLAFLGGEGGGRGQRGLFKGMKVYVSLVHFFGGYCY